MNAVTNIALLVLAGIFLSSPVWASGESVYIAELKSVKLIPKENFKEQKFPDGTTEITVSNSCGTAEASYLAESGETIVATMSMGEWCRNPYDIKHGKQLIVVTSNGVLTEYYSVEEDSQKRQFADVEDTSKLVGLRSSLSSPYLLNWIEDNDDVWYYKEDIESGLVTILDKKVYLLKGVYLDDVREFSAP